MATFIAERKIDNRLLKVLRGNLTEEVVDAIVNAANENLAHGGGLAGAIVRAGGQEIQIESREKAPIPTGGAVSTGAGKLPCKRVIHAVGPVWNSYSPNEADHLLSQAVVSSLLVATNEMLVSISIPAISSGIFGFPKKRCAHIMLQAILGFFRDHSDSSLREIRLCNVDEPTVHMVHEALLQVLPE